MVGFVGAQARRRRRNRYILIVSIIFVFVIFFYLPSINFSTDESQPQVEIIPINVVDK